MPILGPTSLALACAAIVVPAAVSGQTCSSGSPPPRCRSILITELGYLHRVDGPHGDVGAPQVHYLNGEVGLLLNRGGRAAVGATLFAGALVDYAFTLRVGVKGRGRYWLGPRTSLEAGAGPVLGHVTRRRLGDQVVRTRAGLTSHVALNLGDRLSLLAALETLRNETEPGPSIWIGARLGSRPAAWAGGIAGLVLGVAASLMGS